MRLGTTHIDADIVVTKTWQRILAGTGLNDGHHLPGFAPSESRRRGASLALTCPNLVCTATHLSGIVIEPRSGCVSRETEPTIGLL